MNTPESIRDLAVLMLSRARIPQRGPMFDKAVNSSASFGPSAHHAACVLHHAEQIEQLLALVPPAFRKPAEQAVSQALMAGQHLALVKERQKKVVATSKQERNSLKGRAAE